MRFFIAILFGAGIFLELMAITINVTNTRTLKNPDISAAAAIIVIMGVLALFPAILLCLN